MDDESYGKHNACLCVEAALKWITRQRARIWMESTIYASMRTEVIMRFHSCRLCSEQNWKTWSIWCYRRLLFTKVFSAPLWQRYPNIASLTLCIEKPSSDIDSGRDTGIDDTSTNFYLKFGRSICRCKFLMIYFILRWILWSTVFRCSGNAER